MSIWLKREDDCYWLEVILGTEHVEDVLVQKGEIYLISCSLPRAAQC